MALLTQAGWAVEEKSPETFDKGFGPHFPSFAQTSQAGCRGLKKGKI